MIWAIIACAATTQLLLLVVVWWLFSRAYRVLSIYSKGWTWCVVKTLHGTKVEGWVAITVLRSLGSRTYSELPAIIVRTHKVKSSLAPTELDSIHEVVGLFKVTLRSGGYGIE